MGGAADWAGRRCGAPGAFVGLVFSCVLLFFRQGPRVPAAALLRQALEIYRKIGAPGARLVQDTLASQGR